MQCDLALKQIPARAKSLGITDPRAYLHRAREDMTQGLALCESPIEKHLLPWLVVADYGEKVFSFPAPVCDVKRDGLPARGDIVIVPQFTFAKYRCDFAVIRRFSKSIGIVAVECDGEEYHSAHRDVLRDGWLASFNIATVRFSGKHIYANPQLAAAVVAECVILLGDGAGR